MAGLAQLWSWIEEPLRQLTADHTSRPDVPWETERAQLVERLGLREATDHPLVDQLVRGLDEMSASDRNSTLSGDQLTTVAYAVAQQHAVEPAEPTPTTPAYDESAWSAYLATNGPYWDGTEESWQQFRDWFRYHAEEQGLGVPATGLLDFLAARSASDRIATFARYGVTIRPPARPVAPPAQVDQAVLDELLAEHPEFAAIPEARRLALIASLRGE
jgi:hypothetical protein